MVTKTILFGAVIVAAASFAFCQNNPGAQQKTTAKPAATVAAADNQPAAAVKKTQNRQLVVYYFMTTYRCPSCIFIEETTRKAVNEAFAQELKSGRIVFKMINIEEKGNEHFSEDYQLYTKSVVLSDLKDGKQEKWKNLDQVWNMIRQEERFKTYIVNEIKALL